MTKPRKTKPRKRLIGGPMLAKKEFDRLDALYGVPAAALKKPRAKKKTPKRAAYAGAADRAQTHYDGCWKNHGDCFPPDDAYGDVPNASDLARVARLTNKLPDNYNYRAEWEKPAAEIAPTRWERFVAWLKARLS